MSKEVESCKIILDDKRVITPLICHQLKMENMINHVDVCLGFLLEGQLCGGVLFSDFRPKCDVWISIWTNNKRWCNRRIIKSVFEFAFNFLDCRRINALINTDNLKSLRLAEGLGFCREGKMRQYREDGRDVYVLGMLKNECKYLINKEKKYVK